MLTLTDRQCFGVAVLFYGLSTLYWLFLWKDGFRHHNRVNYFLLLIGFGFHTAALVQRGFSLARCPVNNLYEATTFVAWTILAAYLVVGLWSPLKFLGAFASPILLAIGTFALMPNLDPKTPPGVPEFSGGLLSFHAAVILLAYGSFGLSCVAGLMYLSQEHDLRFRKLRAVLSLLPPIQRLERLIGQLLVSGFVLLSVGLVAGALYLKQTKGTFYQPDAKLWWSYLVWLIYLTLLVVHWRFHQTGRRFVWGAVASFAFVFLTFWGTNLLSGIHHQ